MFWDWEQLYYVGTVILKMSEQTFWRCTPRKLFALMAVHVDVNSTDEQRAKHGRRNKNTEQNNKEVVNSIASW
jgi:uncharacterized phage protein (TIGR02216 family)